MDPITLIALGAGAYFLSRKKKTAPISPAPPESPEEQKGAPLPTNEENKTKKAEANKKVKKRQERRKKIAARKKQRANTAKKPKRANTAKKQRQNLDNYQNETK